MNIKQYFCTNSEYDIDLTITQSKVLLTCTLQYMEHTENSFTNKYRTVHNKFRANGYWCVLCSVLMTDSEQGFADMYSTVYGAYEWQIQSKVLLTCIVQYTERMNDRFRAKFCWHV